MRMLIALAVVAVSTLAVAVILLFSTRGGDDATGDVNLALPCTNTATIEAVREQNRGALTPEPSGTRPPFQFSDDETECRLRRALLAEQDLPAGWKRHEYLAEPYSGGDRLDSDGPGPCGVPLLYLRSGLRSVFADSRVPEGEVRLLQHALYLFEESFGRDVFDALRRSCAPFGAEEGSGVELALVDSASLGEASIGLLQTYPADEDEQPRVEYRFYILHGDLLEEISYGGEHVSAGDGLDLARRAQRKMAPYLGTILPGDAPVPAPTPVLDAGSVQAALTDALLSVEDLPRFWLPLRNARGYQPADLLLCADIDYALPRASRNASAAFYGGQWDEMLSTSVLLYASPSDAASTLEGLASDEVLVEGCNGKVRDEDVTWHFKRLDIASAAQQITAWEAVSRDLSDPLQANVATLISAVILRQGPLVGVIVSVREFRDYDESFASFGLEQLKEYVDAAAIKLTDAERTLRERGDIT